MFGTCGGQSCSFAMTNMWETQTSISICLFLDMQPHSFPTIHPVRCELCMFLLPSPVARSEGRSVRRSLPAPGVSSTFHFHIRRGAMQLDATRCISDRSHTVFSSHKNAASYVMKASSTRSQYPLKQQARRPRLLQKRKDILGVALVERAAKGSNSCLPRKPQARAKYRGSLAVWG